MGLTLTIENLQNLPDGGPLSYTVTGKRGIDIGREQYLDWTLPDPTRYISGKHCEVRYQDGGYQLYDVSTNGTFLNGSNNRMQSPHRLRSGDRLTIGQYIVAVDVDGGEMDAPAQAQGHTPGAPRELWGDEGEIAPPIDPKELRPPSHSHRAGGDFLEQAMGSPDLYDMRGAQRAPDPYQAPPASGRAADPDFDWAPPVARAAPVVEPPPAAPMPRRSAAPAAASVWGDEAPAAAPAPMAEPVFAEEPAPAPAKADNPFTAPVPAPAAPIAASVAAAPVSAPAPAPYLAAGADDFVARFAAGAGMPAGSLSGQDAGALAQKAGEIMRGVVVDMMQLLNARTEAKRLARSSSQTMIQALDNNPLKFSPNPEDALRIMLGPQTKSYLDARRALAQGFSDIKTHQVRTYSAMQAAMRMIAAELDPDAIEKASPATSGLSEMLGSRKARLWEAYAARWKAKTEHHDDGLVDVFMLYFADCYDRGADGKS